MHDQEWTIYVAMALVGLGIGFAFSAMSNLVVEAVPVTQTGVATGMNANVRTIGGSIGSAGRVRRDRGGRRRRAPSRTSAATCIAFLVMGIALAGAGVAAAFVPSREARRARRRRRRRVRRRRTVGATAIAAGRGRPGDREHGRP